MGETRKDALRLDFDRKLKLEFHGTKVTSDAGLLPDRRIGRVDGQTCLNRAPYCGIVGSVACRSTDYDAKWQIPAKLMRRGRKE